MSAVKLTNECIAYTGRTLGCDMGVAFDSDAKTSWVLQRKTLQIVGTMINRQTRLTDK